VPSSSQERALKGLRIAVVSWSMMGLVGIPLFVLFDVARGWRWEPDNPIYDQMIVSIYVALGLVMARAIRDPLAHWSLLEFTVVSSVFHGGVMLWHAVADPMHRGHLIGDVWILAGAIGLAIPMYQLRDLRPSLPTPGVANPAEPPG
jgi:hypothetical protein